MINIENLDFGYEKDPPVLLIEKLQILKGEKVFIYGKSGSGKSTFLNLISGVLTPISGEITFQEKPFSSLKSSKRDKIRGDEIGYIFQRFNLIDYLSVRENILLPLKLAKKYSLGKKDYDKRLLELCEDLEVSSLLDRKVDKLSVGQQQRVAVVRALISRPKLVIADEPTSSLDAEVTESFLKLLLNEWEIEKFTLIFVSHDKRLAKFFDKTFDLAELNKVSKQ